MGYLMDIVVGWGIFVVKCLMGFLIIVGLFCFLGNVIYVL